MLCYYFTTTEDPPLVPGSSSLL